MVESLNLVRARVLISGRVQGVCFRYYTQKEAQNRNVTGYVRNCPDKRVEAVFEGRREDVEKLVSWCREGPSGAVVKDIAIERSEHKNEFNSFFIAT